MDDEDEYVPVPPVRADWFDVVIVGVGFLTGCTGSLHNSMQSLAQIAAAHGNWRIDQRKMHEQVAREIETLPTKE